MYLWAAGGTLLDPVSAHRGQMGSNNREAKHKIGLYFI